MTTTMSQVMWEHMMLYLIICQTHGCCAQIGMPLFFRKLLMKAAEHFEICNCKGGPSISDEDIAVEKIELFVL